MYKDTPTQTGKERQAIADKKRYELHKEHLLELKRKWQKNNADKHNAHNRKYRKTLAAKDPIFYRKQNLKSKYGITIEQWNTMFEEQKGNCKICGIHQSKLNRPLETDHSHLTGKVRGLLCHKCNSLLCEANVGKFKENDLLYSKALGYITINLN